MERTYLALTEADIQRAKHLDMVSEETLSQYFRSQEIKDYLSPQGRMIVDLVPLQMIDSNIVYMKGPQGYTMVYADIRSESGICSGLLSFGTVFEDQRSKFHCNLDVFGTDTNSLKQHIVRHVIDMRSKLKGIARIMVMISEEFNLEKIDSVFKEFGIQRTIWNSSVYPHLRYSKIFLYEITVHPSKY